MRNWLPILATSILCSQAVADVYYYDATNDLFDNSLSNLDISRVDVYHDETNVYMTVNLAGDFENGSDWGAYMLAIDAFDGGTGSNAWERPIDFAGVEIDRFIGTWVNNGGGHNAYSHFGGWNQEFGHTSAYHNEIGFVSFTISRAWLGLEGAGSFDFDVMSTSGDAGKPGVDHLSRSDMATAWWDQHSTSGTFLTYSVPAPGALMLLGLAGIAARSRRRRR